MKAFFKDQRKLILIGFGCALLIYAVWNSYSMIFPTEKIQGTITPVVEQEGFAPMVIPQATIPSKIFEPTPVPVKIIPTKLVIEKIELEAPIEPVEQISVRIAEQNYAQFLVPEYFAAGWHSGSAPLGVIGNTVISGHHNAFGMVFKLLKELEVGDIIKIFSADGEEFKYIVSNKLILKEKDEPLEIRLENGRWILPTDDERLTLVTCWPDDSNSHRLIIVAVPVPDYSQFDYQPPLLDVIANIDLKTPAVLLINPQTVTPKPLDVCIAQNTSPFDINIRLTPSLNGEILYKLAAGDEAKCVGKSEKSDWIKIYYENVEGWISSELVIIQPDIDLLPVLTPTE